MCKTPAIADIVILVDGSWSIGRINFRLVRTFLENLVKAFSVDIDKTRIGLAQYSGDPRIEWHLNTHSSKEAVIEAVKNLPYKGGNTLTGLALTFILENSFKPESGSRAGVPKIGILITDGKSQDDVIPPAQSLKEAGIELFAIGVKNADEAELKGIASPPLDTHVYNVADFSVMSDIVEGLTRTVCERVELLDKQIKGGGEPAPPPSAVSPPRDLVTSDITARMALPMVHNLDLFDITHSTMMVRWRTAAGASGYMILYAPLTEGDAADEKEVKVDASVNEVELEGLTPSTEYTVTVYALYGEEASDPMTSQETTLPLLPAMDLRFSDVTHSSAKLTWDAPSKKVKGYRIMYVKTSGTQINERRCRTQDARRLLSRRDPLDLSSSDVSTDSFRVNWKHAASDVVLYRITWTSTDGGDSDEVMVNGNTNTYLIKGLTAATEYEVLLAAIYANEVESDEVILVQNTAKKTTTIATTTTSTAAPRFGIRNLRIDDETTYSLRVSWQPVDSRNIRHYRLSYVSAKGDRAEETRTVPSAQSSLVLQPLLSDTEYKVALTPVYSEGDGPTSARSARTPTPTYTCKPHPPPHCLCRLRKNLRVSEEWYNRFRISWDVPPSPTMGYRIVYQPVSAPGPALETFVGEDVNTMLILNLLSGMDYSVKVIASYTTGSSEALTGRAKTLYLGVNNLRVYQAKVYSLCVQWQPHRHANAYRVNIEALSNGQKQEVKLPGGTGRHCFTNLKPNSLYKVSVYAQLQDGTEGPAVTVSDKTLPVPTPAPTKPPTTTPLPTIPAAKEVCKAAKADLVFLVDGSWSIGDENFLKIIGFLYSTSGALDQIGPDGTQVAIAQFSDDARTEFKLNSYSDKEKLLDAINRISYKGGNTKTGRAIQHVREQIFTTEGGVRRGVPKVLVVLTDGRSQDDVNKVSKELQMEGYIVFAIGFADADYGELVSIASKPSERHVFFVDDLDAFKKIEEKLVTFVCEAATATCPAVPMSGSTTPGFRMMDLFGLVEDRYSSLSGVSLVPGTFNTFPCFRLHNNAMLAQPTKYLHPEGLPSDYTISLLFRLLPNTPPEPFAVWEILDKTNEPVVGVIMDNGGKTLTFFNNDYKGEFQTVTFEGPEIQKLFYGSFHKLHIAISKTSARVVIDCKSVTEKNINAAGNISTDGVEVLGRMVRSRDNRDNSATFELQSFDIVCSTSWANRDKCCELPGLRKEVDCPAMPKACTCTQDSKGPPGLPGPPVSSHTPRTPPKHYPYTTHTPSTRLKHHLHHPYTTYRTQTPPTRVKHHLQESNTIYKSQTPSTRVKHHLHYPYTTYKTQTPPTLPIHHLQDSNTTYTTHAPTYKTQTPPTRVKHHLQESNTTYIHLHYTPPTRLKHHLQESNTTYKSQTPPTRGGPGIRGARGDRGEPGPVGPMGPVGETGVAGPQGPQGPQGPSGRSIIGPPGGPGERGQKGDPGQPGSQGIPGRAGSPGPAGAAGQRREKEREREREMGREKERERGKRMRGEDKERKTMKEKERGGKKERERKERDKERKEKERGGKERRSERGKRKRKRKRGERER
ncbi:hypothetical protein WMY93_003208 [Mugilogobius chulae]|uniref:Collagen alpha-1(XIV) chain n=1 Tax=Mugilogobius chulae TaxID=88201 RepID=A0AAW0Q6P2_9GOBI